MPATAPHRSTATFIRSDKIVVGGGGALVVLAGIAHYAGWNSVLAFVVAAGAICLLASLVGRSVEQLGDRFGAGRPASSSRPSATCPSCSSASSR